MFRKFKQNLIIMYTFSTGLILTLIVVLAFFFTYISQKSRSESDFQSHLFTLTSKLHTDSLFTDSYLASMELQNQLVIHIEENEHPLFFPGSYKTGDDRSTLLKRVADKVAEEGIYEDSQPISSNVLKSSIFRIKDLHGDTWVGNMVVLRTDTGCKKLILLSDETPNRMLLIKTGLFYVLIDLVGIFLLYMAGRRFVRQTTAPLEQAYQKQQDFIAAASHELRSPLAVIQSNAAAIADAPFESGRLLAVIQRECDRGSSLVKKLLLLASVDRHDFLPQKQLFEIDRLLLQLLEIYEPVFCSKGGNLLLELPDEILPCVKADLELCRQIFTVLLDNALFYGLEQSQNNTVVMKAENKGNSLSVFVIDYGMGIPDEEKKRIFERFYRSDRSRNAKEHFGLGLSLALELARAQNLLLDLSDTEGGGCTFIVRFHVKLIVP